MKSAITKARMLTVFMSFLLLIQNAFSQETPYVIIVSMDGFRWDYTQHARTPNLDSIATFGVKAEHMKASFPTKTFPNHYTLATGLYPDHHGIVHNSFYDPATGRDYSIRDRKAVSDGSFYGGEPIWVTAEKQGVRSASFYWVGTEAPIQGIHPSYWKKYDHSFPFEQRIDTVIHWLQLPEEQRPHLVMLYFHDPDEISHEKGPNAIETYQVVEYLDSLIGVLCKKVNALPVAENVNLVIVSDHGMGPITKEKTVYLNDFVKDKWFLMVRGSSPVFNFQVKEKFKNKAFETLSSIPHTRGWEHGSLPERLHYGTNPRTLDYILTADSAWQISTSGSSDYGKGEHGYDNENPDMFAIFYAIGPAFKSGYSHPPFENVNVYTILAYLLGIKPAPTDGKLENVTGLFKENLP